MSTTTPERGVAARRPDRSPFEPQHHRTRQGVTITFPPGYLAALTQGYPDEAGVPACAEDAAEEILRQPLRRPRHRSPYARYVNPVLTALHPDREISARTGAVLVGIGLALVTIALVMVL